MMKRLVAVLVVSLLSTGCIEAQDGGNGRTSTTSSSSASNPCAEGYVVGCDSNPDARRMLDEYGLHQITNTTWHLSYPLVDNGLAAWSTGAGTEPSSYNAYSIQSLVHYSFKEGEETGKQERFPSGDRVLYGLTPIKNLGKENQDGDYENSTVWIWEPMLKVHTGVPIPEPGSFQTDSGGFAEPWALLLQYPLQENYEHGLLAVNVDTGVMRPIWEIAPKDGSPYGTPQVSRAIANGSVFYTLLTYSGGQPVSRIMEVDLETGQVTERLNVTNNAVLQFTASDDYVVVPATIEGHQELWAMDRQNHTWWDILEVPRRVVVPMAGGDWVVYLQAGPMGNDDSRLVGTHLPSGRSFILLPNHVDFSIVDWDTDGQYVVVKLAARSPDYTTMRFGTQIFWFELPPVFPL